MISFVFRILLKLNTPHSRFQRARPIVIDPGLYHSKKSGVFWAKEKRSVPAAFKLFMGILFTFISPAYLFHRYPVVILLVHY